MFGTNTDVNPMSTLASVIDVVNVDGNGAIASQWRLILAKDSIALPTNKKLIKK